MASSNIRIESAYYGDEKSFSNITASFINRVIGGNIAVTANGDLKPTFEAATETKLEAADEKEIREEAVKACGGEADQKCLEATKLKLSQEKLKEKERTDLGKGVMKGDRLTVNIVDGNGKRRTLITPAGQEFKLQNVIGGTTNTPMGLPTLEKTQERVIMIVTVIVSAFVWVFSIVANYAIFMREAVATGKDSYRIVAYVTAAIAALFPGAGFFTLMFWFGFNSFLREYVART
jgi:hypothetical protein